MGRPPARCPPPVQCGRCELGSTAPRAAEYFQETPSVENTFVHFMLLSATIEVTSNLSCKKYYRQDINTTLILSDHKMQVLMSTTLLITHALAWKIGFRDSVICLTFSRSFIEIGLRFMAKSTAMRNSDSSPGGIAAVTGWLRVKYSPNLASSRYVRG